jgi:multidrug efflux pump subunit AcrA (membrane-fusion protein)
MELRKCKFAFLCVLILGSNFLLASVHIEKKPTVFVLTAKRTEISRILSYPALIEARVHATVLAETDGVVRKIHFALGKKVAAGSPLLTLQQTDPIFQYATVSTKAPVTGVVSEINVTEGALVTKGQKLASVTDPKNLKILVEVPAQDISSLRVGLEGSFESPSIPDKVPLHLAGLSPNVDPATGTASSELIPQKGERSLLLRPGMIGKVTFKTNLRSGFVVPEDAVIKLEDRKYLRLVVDGKVSKVPVSIGDRQRGEVEVTAGLEEGAKIVARSSGFVADGDEVMVEESKSPGEGH